MSRETTGSQGRSTILLVEDQELLALAQKQLLESRGYQVQIELTGAGAIEASQRSDFDLVLMDLTLGGGQDGSKVAARMHKNKPDLPIVFVSSHAEKEFVSKTRGLGGYAYILKNSGEEVFLASVEMAMLLGQARKQEAQHRRELRQAKELYHSLVENLPMSLYRTDINGQILYANKALEDFLGLESSQIVGRNVQDFYSENMSQKFILKDNKTIWNRKIRSEEDQIIDPKSGEIRTVEYLRIPVGSPSGGCQGLQGVFWDITTQTTQRKILETQLTLIRQASQQSPEDIMRQFLDHAEVITNSAIGFFHFINEKTQELNLSTWSTNTMQTICHAHPHDNHYPVSKAGIWADAARRRSSVIHNDYSREKGKKGMPEGHAPLIREAVVPVFREGEIVAILGVGNKPTDYLDRDVQILESFADLAWETISRRKSQQRITKLLDEKNLLLREVHHRIKNNMSTMISLLALQEQNIEHTSCKDALREAQNRLSSMMVLYEKIYQKASVKTLNLAEYLEALAQEILDAFPQKVTLVADLEPVSIPVGGILSLGILLNEVITNSMKYAFTKHPDPRITIELHQENQKLIFVISDNGPGFSPESHGSSFGLNLIQTLAGNIQAKLCSTQENGTRYHLTIPLET